MSLLDALRYRWRVLTRPSEHAADVADDMEFFLGSESRQREHAGHGTVSAEDARNVARRRFGNRTFYREEVRRESGLQAFDVLAQDARFAFRTFARTPGFTAITIATLAIGIGANTAIFSAVDTLLLAPLPFRSPDRLMNVALTIPAPADPRPPDDMVWSWPKLEAFQQGQDAFSSLTAWSTTQYTVRLGDEALRLWGEFVDSRYFTTLGIAPALGRTMLPDENRPGGPAVAVLSDALWRAAFDADTSAIGKVLRVDGAAYTIIGVAPPGFAGVGGQAQFWIPFLSSPAAWDNANFLDPNNHNFHVIGRLSPGITPERAAIVASELGPRVDERFPELGPRARHWGIRARTLDETRLDVSGRRTLVLLFSAVGLVLLVACANVANLFLGRAASRRREIAVRLAIGASRARVVRQLLVESVLLALAGGAASLVIAAVGVRVITAMRPALWGEQSSSGIGTVFVDAIHLNVTAFAFTAAIAIATGLLFGLAPAIQSTRPELQEALRTDAGWSQRLAVSRRLSMRDALTTFEIALAVILLAGSGVLVRSLIQLSAVHPGFEAEGVLTMRVNRAPEWSRDSITHFYDVAVDRLRAVPGVTQVAMADCVPQGGSCSGGEVVVLDLEGGARKTGTGLHRITPDWHNVMRVPLLRGRSIEPTDRRNTPAVAVVSQRAARDFWPNEDPLGKRLVVEGRDTVRVVGVMGDVRYFGLHRPPEPGVYVSNQQFPLSFRMMLLMRVSASPAGVVEPARRALQEAAPGFPVYDVATLKARIGSALGQTRFLAQLLSLFAVLSLVLATIGTYGVISYSVTRRTREMGIRTALGATRRDLTRLVVGQGVVLAAAGGMLGLVGALAGMRLIRSLLYGVEPADPITLVGIVLLLMLVVLVASWVPARRAAGVPAVQALRAG